MAVVARLVACLLLIGPPATLAQIKVMGPSWLIAEFPKTQGKIEGSTATFGAPFYGDRLMGRLSWGESLHGVSHCREDDYFLPPELASDDHSQVRLINIVLVRRGVCSFTTKVRVAMKKGAHAVVIVDHEESQLKAEDIRNVVVADDGYGDRITIPSLLVSKEDGRKLIDAASRARVLAELAWDVPMDNVVRMDLWMSSASQESQRFLTDFSRYRRALGDKLQFIPHFHVFSVPASATHKVENLCSDSTAKYCAEDPDANGPLQGKDVLLEDVRQLCIHELTHFPVRTLGGVLNQGSQANYSAQFWNYLEQLPVVCPLDGMKERDRFGTACSESLQKRLKIDLDAVRRCVETTQAMKLEEQREDTAWSPRALRINGWRYVGVVDADLVTRAICAGFLERPDSCRSLLTRRRGPFAEESALSEADAGGPVVGFSLPFLVGSAGAVATLALLIGRKYFLTQHLEVSLRRDVAVEVQQQMEDAYKRMPY